jgi:tetratricopeptide (TPR) repeat protein
VPLSTVISRLLEGRELLRRRLAARGLALSLALAGFSLVSPSGLAGLRPGLVGVTSRVAVQVFANGVAASDLSPKVLSLVQGGIQAMIFKKLKVATAVVLAVLLSASGAAKFAQWALAQNSGKASPPLLAAEKQSQPKQPTTVPQPKKADVPEARQPLKEARAAADAVKDPQWKAWLLDIIGGAQLKSGNKAAAAQVFQDAIRAAKEIKGDNLNDPSAAIDTTLSGIAWTQASAGDVTAALQTVEAIENDQRREQALAEVARAQARSGDVKGALKAAEAFSEWKDYVLAEAATLLADSGDLNEAVRVVDMIANQGERVRPLAALARAQFKKKDLKGAQKTLQISQDIVGRMDKDHPGDARTVALAQVAEAQADTGDLKGARQTIDAIKDARWKGPALGHLAVVQADMGLFKESLDTLGDIEHDYHVGEALTNIVKAQLRQRHFQRAQETADTINNVSWSMHTWVEIAVAQAKAGDRISALKSLKKAIDYGGLEGKEIVDDEPNLGVGAIRNATLSLIARTRVQMGDEEEAFVWARKQATPELRVLAFIRIAEGIELRKAGERAAKK